MTTPTCLIIVVAFDPDPETGDLLAGIEPVRVDSADRAIRMAMELAGKHAGVIA